MKSGVVIKLWLAISVLAVVALLVLSVVVSRQMEGLYDYHLSEHLLTQANGLVAQYAPDPENPGDRPWKSQEAVIGAQIAILTPAEVGAMAAGKPVTTPVYLPPDQANMLQTEQSAAFRTDRSTGSAFAHDHGHGEPAGQPRQFFVVAVPLLQEGSLKGALVLTAPVTPVAQTVTLFRRTFTLTAVFMLAGVTMVALYLSSRLSLPLREMDAMAQAMAAGDFRRRVKVRGTDEVGHLGRSINRLAETLDCTIAKLGENNARLSGILSSMSDAVMLVDEGGRFALLNGPAEALLLAADLPCVRPSCDSQWACLERLGVAESVRQVRAEPAARAEKVRLHGQVYAVHYSPVPDEQGEVAGVVLVWQDITQGERLEEMRRDFVANVSHEMRTPIGLVRGYAEALQDGMAESPEERNELLGIMQQELDRVEALVRDLLQLARLDAGQLPLEPEPLALEPQVVHLLKKLAPLIEKTGVTVRAEIPGDLPLVLADADRLEQVMLNLLENGLRYAPRGSTITIGAARESDRVTVLVDDQGPGIPPKERSLVWERFYRCDPAHSRKKGGTGLGLAVVRGIITAHGGQTWVEEAPGGGSRFAFTLPLAER